MARQRAPSNASTASSVAVAGDQELGSMYDYLAKIILLGPSGTGKSCLLHRFVKNEWRVLSSQTIGVEFSSKIIRVGTGARRKRIKLQLWDTAGTERFRSVSRSYYRGAAGAILVYDIASHLSFSALPTFLNDARALASPQLSVLLVGNKVDLSSEGTASASASLIDAPIPPPTPSSSSISSKTSKTSQFPFTSGGSVGSTAGTGLGARNSATVSTDGREVSTEEASRWASSSNVPVSVEVSALSGDNVEDVFTRLAQVILTKIELGEIDPDDPQSGIQYGDSSTWTAGASDGGSIKSGMTLDDGGGGGGGGPRRRRGRGRAGTGNWLSGVREWEEVFKIRGVNRRNRGGCC